MDVMAEQGTGPQAWRCAGAKWAVLALALVASACVGRREPAHAPEPATQADVRRPTTPGERNRVAVLVPLTGPDAGVGTSIANAANLALIDSGATSVRLTVYDTAPGAAVAANAALTDGNRLFLGPLTAEDVRAIGPVARRGGVPVIAFSNDAGVAGNGTYIMGFTPDQSVDRVVRHARGKGAVRFAALVPEGTYGQRTGAALTEAVSRASGRLIAVQGFGRSTASLTAAVRALGAEGAYDAVMIADTPSVAAAAAQLVRGGPSRGAQVLGTELWSTDRVIGNKAALRGAWFAGVPDARFDQLVTRYRARYKRIPYRLASLGYDGVLLAVRINRSWDIGARFPERMLLDPDGFSGVDGAFRFRRDGTAERRMAVHAVTASGTTIVSPAATGFGG